MALRERPESLRWIANRLIDNAKEGGLSSAREVADRLDGRPAQMIDRHEVVVAELSDAELNVIAVRERIENEVKIVPPMPSE